MLLSSCHSKAKTVKKQCLTLHLIDVFVNTLFPPTILNMFFFTSKYYTQTGEGVEQRRRTLTTNITHVPVNKIGVETYIFHNEVCKLLNIYMNLSYKPSYTRPFSGR